MRVCKLASRDMLSSIRALKRDQEGDTFPQASPVTIRYSQSFACTFVKTDLGGASTGPNAAYVVFAIDGFDNSGGSSAPFAFDQTKLFVVDPHTGGKDFVEPNLSIYRFVFGPFAAVSETIPAFTNESFQADEEIALVVTTATADGAVEANQTAYELQYDRQPGDPPVQFVKTNAGQTTFGGSTACN